MTELVERNGHHEAMEASAIYLPGLKLFWWDLQMTNRTAAEAVQGFKKYTRCAADPSAIVCFGAPLGSIFARRVSSKVDHPDIPALVSTRISEQGADVVHWATFGCYQRIFLRPVEGIAPLFERSLSEVGGPGFTFDITRIVPYRDGWEITLRNNMNGRVGAVRLDGEMRPVSGTMIK